ncbi:Z1 domain-containing protein [Rothia sp. HMSC076D04]|uniref:Z1 domain-containing protein n=1 Tax=Rothia sp. HMSC076D04 TaxID=1739484 RepID=UPI000AEC3662|nr:Z1 domain-containing protein [Rothia sp. HMSC076D04]
MEENNCQKELVETAKQAIQEVAKINGLSYQEAWNRKINELRMFSAPEEQFMPVYKEALRILEEEGSNNDHEGKAWPFLRKTLQKQIKNKEAVKTIDRESGEILNLLVNLNEKGVKRKGLVVGYVQSGKTANFSAVITKAVDEGYRLVIVMTGILESLRSQTQARLQNGVADAIIKSKKSVISLTSVKSDISSDDASNLEANLHTGGVAYAVVKKNHNCLKYLMEQLRIVNQKGLLKDVPVLIIDDESDQATPNTANKTEDYSTINGDMRQIWEQVQQGSYVAYTATPFANVFMNPKDEERYTEHVESDNPENPEGETIERYPGLYPSDFIYALERPNGYIGASRIFGTPLWATEDEDGTLNDGVDIDALRDIDTEEAKILRHPTRKDGGDYIPEMVPSLEAAVQWFMIATALRRRRTQKQQHSSMLIHLSHLKETHFEVEKVIKDYISKLKENCGKPEINDAMQSLYEREVARMLAIRPEKIYPDWDELKLAVSQVVRETKCIVENSASDEQLKYEDKEPLTCIVIGGNALSRGLTLEGLICSYYLRKSKTYDALLQMGRWFGFRPGYEDLIRLWTTEDIQEDYRYLADIEDELREEIREIDDPSVVAVKIRADRKKLNVTSPNKMRNAAPVNINHSGKSYQVTRFEEQNDKCLKHNIQVLESLIKSIGSTQEALRGKNNGSYLFEGVPVGTIIDYLTNYQVHPSNPGIDADRLVKWIAENVTQNWNVVIYSDTDENRPKRDFAGYEIRMADRTAVKSKSTEGIVDIKSLANPQTYVLDLRILAHHGKIKISEIDLKKAEKDSGKKLRSLNGNSPLLVVYVVNPKSQANRSGRRDLDAVAPVVLHTIVIPKIVSSGKSNHFSVDALLNNDLGLEEE